MTKYIDFFLKSPSSIIQFECFEVSHSSFSKTFRIVRNATDGLKAKVNGKLVDYEFCPCEIRKSNTTDDLEQSLTISMAGILLDQIMPEINRIRANGNFAEKPKLIYRTYRSDDLENVMFGDIELKIVDFSFTHEGLTFKASFDSLNSEKLGLFYTFDNFECLKSFL